MLSFYDALSFSTRKKTQFFGLITALIMLTFFIFCGVFLEQKFLLYSSFRSWLTSETGSPEALFALSKIAANLQDPTFWRTLYKLSLFGLFFIIMVNVFFFSLELVIAKKDLFNQPKHFTATFFLITLSKFLFMLSPIIILSYIGCKALLKYSFFLLTEKIFNMSPKKDFPFDPLMISVIASTLFFYFIYTCVRFSERFSFVSLFKTKPFFRHIKTFLELMFKTIFLTVLFGGFLAGLAFVLYKLPFIHMCFFVVLGYLFLMVILNESRFTFIAPVLALAVGLFVAYTDLGKAFMSNYFLYFMVFGVLYFLLFFLFASFWSMQAYLIASTSFVLRFNKTAERDEKKHSPDKLRRLESLYNDYLREHNNENQDNFFHHITGDDKK